jgi:hypothetical protein
VYFNNGSSEIPNRYVLLNKDQVKDFKEDQLEVFSKKFRSFKRQMTVYYNILNILGDRMQKIQMQLLVGSSEQGPADGLEMSESIKTYLVDVFAINPSRISTKGQSKPNIPSEQPGGTLELALLREGDRRVSIESNSPSLLMEFQSGDGAQLKPVKLLHLKNPASSYVTFNNRSWRSFIYMVITNNEQGKSQSFGPYTEDEVRIRKVLGSRPEEFQSKMIGQTKVALL